MKKIISGAILGGLVFFVWGMVSWMFLPWHANTIKTLPEEQLITDTLKTVVQEPGYYAFPSMTPGGEKLDNQAWIERRQKGPVGALVFIPGGSMMSAKNILIGLLGSFGVAVVSMLVLVLSRGQARTFFHRTLLVGALGLVVALSTHLSYWNWMSFPADFTAVAFLDSLVSFFLLGLVQAPFVPRD